MDERIREMERSGDPRLIARAGVLRCSIEGCQEQPIESVAAWEDLERLRWIIQLQLVSGLNLDIPIDYQMSLPQDYVEHTLAAAIQVHIAKCPRCGEPNDRALYYTRQVIDGLKRLRDNRSAPWSRESIPQDGPSSEA